MRDLTSRFSPIDLFTVTDSDHDDHELPVIDKIDDAIPAHANPITPLPADELLAAPGSGVFRERLDMGDDVLPVFLLADRFDFLGCRRFNSKTISCHDA